MSERIKRYDPVESDLAFREFAKEVANEYHCHFELINDGAYKLVPKRDVK